MKLKQTVLCLALSLCIAVACLPIAMADTAAPQGLWTDYAASAFAGGAGTKADPYQIATAEQLALLAADVNSGAGSKTHTKEYFKLTADIDLSGHVWTPLGYETYASGGGDAKAFQGYFDGNGKKITGLYVDERTGNSWGKNRSAGLFGVIASIGSEEPIIQNLTVENGTVFAGDGNATTEDWYGAGLLIGRINTMYGTNYSVIKNCTVSGTVESTKNAAGLVGDSNYIHFENCTADVKVNGYNTAGGFVGNAFASEFTDCVAKGDVTSNGWCTGGFAGVLFWDTAVKHCAAFGNVEAGDWNLGGFAGFAQTNVTITNSIAMGDVKSNVDRWEPRTGGFLGTACYDEDNNNGEESEFVKLEKCHAAGKVTTADIGSSSGGLLGLDISKNIRVVGCSFDNVKNASLAGVGSNPTGTYGITAQNTAAVLASICVDYYGGHDLEAKPEQKPTCTEDGHEAGSECKRCGYTEGFAVVKAPGHTGGTATCKDKAVCAVCESAYGDLDPANHADLKHTDAKAATGEAEGNIEYWYCVGCGKYYSDAEAAKEITQASTVTPKLSAGTDAGQTGEPDSPRTGDSSLLLWVLLLAVSGSAVMGATLYRKKIQAGR